MLSLQETGGDENWHLLRIDLDNPDDPAVDLTPLPEGSRVFSVDRLTAAPGSVLVTMNQVPRHVDYVLIDVATGETTGHLPARRLE